ncbi:MAG: HEAT repeat domain-containing protein [Deinococcus sp.]|nr:HEAT repeat domain-containing protein [Deinococcus sp.]
MIQRQIAELSDPDKNIRIRAALDLGAAQERSALPELVARLAQEPDFFVREHLTWAVVRMGPDAAPLLTKLLGHPNAAARLQAVHALSKMSDPTVVAALSQAVHDPDSEVARKAIFALGQSQQVTDLAPLMAALGHTDAEHRSTVSTALANFGHEALAPLMEVLRAPQAERRAHAAEVLGLLGEPAAVPALGKALSDEVWEVQFAALSALGQLPGDAAEQAIQQMVQTDDLKLYAVAQRLLDRRPPSPTPLQEKLRQRRERAHQLEAQGTGRGAT